MHVDRDITARIEELAREARAERESFEPPPDPPAPDRAMAVCREGLGPTVSLFVEVRSGGRMAYLSPSVYDCLEEAMNDWIACYAACYDVSLDGEYQLREAAELLVDTHNIKDVAQVLTGVPERN